MVVTQQERVKFDEEKDSKKLGDEGGGGGGGGAESTLAQTFIICQVLQCRTCSGIASVVDVCCLRVTVQTVLHVVFTVLRNTCI